MIKEVDITVKYSTIGYLFVEGFRNVFKNKKSTIASLMIMCATMIIFGIFFIIGENINHIMKEVEEAQGMQVFIKRGTTEEDMAKLEEKIKKMDGVLKVEFYSKEQGLNQMMEKFKGKEELLEDYKTNNILSDSYIVTLSDLNLSQQVQSKINELEGVKRIQSRDQTVTALISLGNGIRIVTLVILVVLVVISIFIISNTIKLTVHARRKEISIMKYVGATNGFIRSPFIVEGMVIGILAGVLSILCVAGAYSIIADKILASSFSEMVEFSLVSFKEMFTLIVIVYLSLGIGIGALGSSISMKKYLDV
jgi:cell division transport system permease protein